MHTPNHSISQPMYLVTVSEMSTPTVEERTDFGDDVLVSLGEYFWSIKEKFVVKKGTKSSREGTLVHGTLVHFDPKSDGFFRRRVDFFF